MADVVAAQGLVQVMRELVADPDGDERSWLGTRLEICPAAADQPGVPGALAGALRGAGRGDPGPAGAAGRGGGGRDDVRAAGARPLPRPGARGAGVAPGPGAARRASSTRCSTWWRVPCGGSGHRPPLNGRAHRQVQQLPGGGQHLVHRDVTEDAGRRAAGRHEVVGAADHTAAGPRHEHAVPRAEERCDVDEVGPREDPHGGRPTASARCRGPESLPTNRSAVQAGRPGRRARVGRTGRGRGRRRCRGRSGCRRRGGRRGPAEQHDPRPRAASSAPSSPSRCGSQRRRGSVSAGMHRDERPGRGVARRVGASRARSASARSSAVTATAAADDRLGPDQRDDLQPAQQIVLEVRPRHGPVEGCGAQRTAAGRDRAPNRSKSGFALPPPPCSCTPRSKPRARRAAQNASTTSGGSFGGPSGPGSPSRRDPRGGQHLVHRRGRPPAAPRPGARSPA